MMFGSRSKQTAQLVAKMERQLDLIHTALIVRDPGTSVSVDAYEGLRKQVVAGATARQAHVAQLAEFDVALRRGASSEDLAALATQWLEQAGVARIEDPSVRDAFDAAVPPDVAVEVEIPGYVNTVTGQLVRQGRLRAVAPRTVVEIKEGGAADVPAAPNDGEPLTDTAAGDDAAAESESTTQASLDGVPRPTGAKQTTETD